jgi:hypothetical protein
MSTKKSRKEAQKKESVTTKGTKGAKRIELLHAPSLERRSILPGPWIVLFITGSPL